MPYFQYLSGLEPRTTIEMSGISKTRIALTDGAHHDQFRRELSFIPMFLKNAIAPKYLILIPAPRH